MLTIAAHLRNTLKKHPLFAEALSKGIVNYSALARMLRPEIQEARMETVSEQTIAVALKRASKDLAKRVIIDQSVQPVLALSQRSGLSVYSIQKSPSIIAIYQQLLSHVASLDNALLYFSQGLQDVNFIVSQEVRPELERRTQHEHRLALYPDCSMVTVTMTHKSLDYPGVCARFFRALAWEHINLISFFHTHGEVSFVVEKKEERKTYEVVYGLAQL